MLNNDFISYFGILLLIFFIYFVIPYLIIIMKEKKYIFEQLPSSHEIIKKIYFKINHKQRFFEK